MFAACVDGRMGRAVAASMSTSQQGLCPFFRQPSTPRAKKGSFFDRHDRPPEGRDDQRSGTPAYLWVGQGAASPPSDNSVAPQAFWQQEQRGPFAALDDHVLDQECDQEGSHVTNRFHGISTTTAHCPHHKTITIRSYRQNMVTISSPCPRRDSARPLLRNLPWLKRPHATFPWNGSNKPPPGVT